MASERALFRRAWTKGLAICGLSGRMTSRRWQDTYWTNLGVTSACLRTCECTWRMFRPSRPRSC
jgi:hypothetical protein